MCYSLTDLLLFAGAGAVIAFAFTTAYHRGRRGSNDLFERKPRRRPMAVRRTR